MKRKRVRFNWSSIVLTDEYLDQMAERFQEKDIRRLTRATFEQYLENPDRYEGVAARLREGYGIHSDEAVPKPVFVISGMN